MAALQWVILGVLAAGGLVAHFHLPGEQVARRAGRFVIAWVRANPFAAVLLVLVVYHALLLSAMPARLEQQVLVNQSSNLRQLRRDPFSALLTSALWTDRLDIWLALPAVVFIAAPAERWLGTLRTLLAFWLCHIAATLIVAAWLSYGITSGWLSGRVQGAVDVGVSYGCVGLLALSLYRFPLRHRVPLIVALLIGLRVSAEFNNTFTDIGHVVSALIGLSLYPLTKGVTVAARKGARWVRVPALPEEGPSGAIYGVGP